MRLLVVQHVPHEGLGAFMPAIREAGGTVRTFNAAASKAVWPRLSEVDGLIVMGGPQSVYQQARYPFLRNEIALLQEALKAKMPILGVCLGSQLLAAALGAPVSANPQKEIGWYPLMREPAAEGDPLCGPFGQTETAFQWHGDAFALPKGATRLFSSPLCPEQGFRYRDNVYALQFHVEVTEAMIRAWMRVPANRAELARLNGIIDPAAIRRQTAQHVDRLGQLARHVATVFCRMTAPRTHTQRGSVHARSR